MFEIWKKEICWENKSPAKIKQAKNHSSLFFLLRKCTSQNGNLKKVTAYFFLKPLSGKKRVRLSAVVMKPRDPRKPSTEQEGCCALHFLSGPVLGQEAWLLPSPWPQLPGRPRSGSFLSHFPSSVVYSFPPFPERPSAVAHLGSAPISPTRRHPGVEE